MAAIKLELLSDATIERFKAKLLRRLRRPAVDDHLGGCVQALQLPLRRLQPRQQCRRVNALRDHVRDVGNLRFEIFHSLAST